MTRLWLATFAILTLSTAQECRPDSSVYEIRSQDELDEISRNCTSIIGGLEILPEYSGSIVLDNIVNITSSIRMVLGDYAGDEISFNVPSVELPDLEHIGTSLYLPGLSLNELSAPRLQSVNQSIYLHLRGHTTIEFPSLTAAESIHLDGNMSTVSVDALETARYLNFINRGSPGDGTSTTPNLDLSLPALQDAYMLHVNGNTSSISVPELTTLNASLALYISERPDPIPIDIPKLTFVGGPVELVGNDTFSAVPALRTVTGERPPGDFTAKTYNDDVPLSVEFELETVNVLSLEGPFERISLPNLRNFTRIEVNSKTEFDCEDFVRTLWERAGNESNTGSVVCGTYTGLSSSMSLNGELLVLAAALVVGGMEVLF